MTTVLATQANGRLPDGSSPPSVTILRVGFPLMYVREAKALLDRAYPHPLRFAISYTTRDGVAAKTTDTAFMEAYARVNAHRLNDRAWFDVVLHAGDAFMRACPQVDLCETTTYHCLVDAYNELPLSRLAEGYTTRGRALLMAAYSGRTECVPEDLVHDIPRLPRDYYVHLLLELFAFRATCVPYVVVRAMFVPETDTLLLGLVRTDGKSPHLLQVALGPRGIAIQRPTYEYHYVDGPGRGMATACAAAPTRSMQRAFDKWADDPRPIAVKLAEPIFSLDGPFAHLALGTRDNSSRTPPSVSFSHVTTDDDMQIV